VYALIFKVKETAECEKQKVKSDITSEGQSVSPSWCRAPSGAYTGFYLLFDSYAFVDVGHPL
jgi:hypothetical protein